MLKEQEGTKGLWAFVSKMEERKRKGGFGQGWDEGKGKWWDLGFLGRYL